MRRESVHAIRLVIDRIPAQNDDQPAASPGEYVLFIPDAGGCRGSEHNVLCRVDFPRTEIRRASRLKQLLGDAVRFGAPKDRSRQGKPCKNLLNHGSKLFESIDTATNAFLSAQLTGNDRAGIRSLLLLQFGDGAKDLSVCVWEAMSSDRTPILLEKYGIARFIPAGRDAADLRSVRGRRLRVLLVISTYDENGNEDRELRKFAKEERSSLADALSDAEAVNLADPLRFLINPSIHQLHEELKRGVQVLHFYGHGGYENRNREFIVLHDPETGYGMRVYLQDNADALFNLMDCPDLRLVVINSCDPESKGDFGSRLVGGLGIPAAITMTNFIDAGVIAHKDGFTRTLYSSIAAGDPIHRAHLAGLQSIINHSPVEAFVPRLTMGTYEPMALVEPDENQIAQMGDEAVTQAIEELAKRFLEIMEVGDHGPFREAVQAAQIHSRNLRITATLERMFRQIRNEANMLRLSSQWLPAWQCIETLVAMSEILTSRKEDVHQMRTEFANQLEELRQSIWRNAERARQNDDWQLLVTALERYLTAWPRDESMRELLETARRTLATAESRPEVAEQVVARAVQDP